MMRPSRIAATACPEVTKPTCSTSQKLLAHRFPNVFRPFPAELVSCATNRHTANVHQFKAAFFESAHFIRCVEPFQDGVSGDHSDSSSATFTSRTRFLMYDRRFSRSIIFC